MSDTILEVKHLKKYFNTPKGTLHAVDDVSFTLERGKTLGIVGESGCGKSTTGRAILRLIEPTAGEVIFNGEDITKKNKEQMRLLRREMQLIFQDPYASLDPRKTVSEIIGEPLKLQKLIPDAKKRAERVHELMEVVGLADRLINTYPHELDGGRRQRVGIGRALALNPKFIVCDEPVSALDVSIQAQVLNLLQDLQDQLGLTYMFITHNLSVVKHISDDLCVMYLGQLVETSPSDEIFKMPLHPYTKALLSAIPSTDVHNHQERIVIKGELTSPIEPQPGCRFVSRCPHACKACLQHQQLEELLPKHFVACCRAKELYELEGRVVK